MNDSHEFVVLVNSEELGAQLVGGKYAFFTNISVC